MVHLCEETLFKALLILLINLRADFILWVRWSLCAQAGLHEKGRQVLAAAVPKAQQKRGTSSPPSRPQPRVREPGHRCLVWNGLRDTIWWCSRDTSHNELREDNAVAL